MRTLIHDVLIITMNPQREMIKGHLIIEDDRMVSVASSSPPFSMPKDSSFDRVIDGRGRIALPGFVQTHVHLCQTLFRGLADDLQLMDWLRQRIWPLEAAHDGSSIYASARLGLAELIRGGTTTIVDMETVHHTEDAFRALEESGIRALAGKVMMDTGEQLPPALLEDTEVSIQQSVDLLERWHGAGDGRIHYAFAPRFAVSCSDQMLREVARLARDYGVFVHTHASENRDEIELVESRTGLRNVEYLQAVGLTEGSLLLAHCIWLDEQEKNLLAEDGAAVSHCPSSNLKLASGLADVPDLQAKGVVVSLGADGAPCANNLDMWMEMRLAALIHKPRYGETVLPAQQVLEMATIEGARAVGLDSEVGSLEPGKKADLMLVDLEDASVYPQVAADPVSRLVYSGDRSRVDFVMIDGKVVFEEGKLRTLSEKEVLEDADRQLNRLLKRSGIQLDVGC